MGRNARLSRPGLVHHVINRGNNKQIVFLGSEDYQEYLNTIERYKKKYKFKLFAYCLMPNHIHLLIKVGELGSISKIMQSITVAHTRRYNDKNNKCGHVWQGRFLSPLVSEDNYFMNAMRYIEQNPVRSGMVKNVEDYKWSSFRLNVRKEKSRLIDREENEIFHQLGNSHEERISVYKKLLKKDLSEKDLDLIHVTTRKGEDFISEDFKMKMKFLFSQRKRGRPPKKN